MSHDADPGPAARWERIESLFLEAIELEPGDREEHLRRRCGGDVELRHEVAAMVAAHGDEARSDLERKLVREPATDPRIGTVLGSYRIVEPIGRGGMGVVYRAERLAGEYEQEVAIKLVRATWLGSEMLSRFGAERQILAQLQHPNIATLLDGGISDEGLPYLVMQYVDGLPITTYCDEGRLPISDRLRLFLQVCEAVAFAHRNLVVHRDLKPSNILVTPEGRVQLLDFGIAKLLDPDAFGLPAASTRTEQRVLTPLHAAPEQLLGGPITTATDVYALGLLLYELTSGRFPYRVERASSLAAQRAIRDSSPMRLADALATAAPNLLAPRRTDHLPAEEIAALRASRPAALRRELAGDLERIALMALRVEPERRYESAAQLAEDLERYLAGEPVRAHADSLAYRTRRLLGRHRAATAAVLAGVVLVTGFSTNAVVQAGRLRTERDRLVAEQERSEAVLSTLVDLFKSAAPEVAQGDTVSLESFLETAAATADSMADRPAVQARLLFALGEMHAVRGEKTRAREAFERAWQLEQQLGEGETLHGQQVFHSLALMNLQLGEVEVGRERMRRSLAWHRRELGESHTDVAQVMTDLARYLEPPEALPLLERALAIRREILPEGDMGIASTVNGLARLHAELGHRQRALVLFDEVLAALEAAVGPSHPNTLIVRAFRTAQLPSAEERLAIYDEMIPEAERVFGSASVTVAGLHDDRGRALGESGRLPEALESCRRAYETAVEAGGATAQQTTQAARSLGGLHLALADYPEALEWFERAEVGTRTDRRRAEILSLQAIAALRLGRLDAALERSELGLALALDSVGDSADDLVLAGNRARHGAVLLALGRHDEAVDVLRASRDALETQGGGPPQMVGAAGLTLGQALAGLGEVDEARAVLEESLARFGRHPMLDPEELASARRALEELAG